MPIRPALSGTSAMATASVRVTKKPPLNHTGSPGRCASKLCSAAGLFRVAAEMPLAACFREARRSSMSRLIFAAAKDAAENCCSPNTRCMSWRNMWLANNASDQTLSKKIPSVSSVTRVCNDCQANPTRARGVSAVGVRMLVMQPFWHGRATDACVAPFSSHPCRCCCAGAHFSST